MALALHKKKSAPPAPPPVARPPMVPAVALPQVERAFFDILLKELYGGMQSLEKQAQKSGASEALLEKVQCLRATVSYAQALLRLDTMQAEPSVPQVLRVSELLNLTVNNLRRELLYAGVAVRREDTEPPAETTAPREALLFLLEELLRCCLRCAPKGRNLHITVRKIGTRLLLIFCTEGEPRLLPPLIPLFSSEKEETPQPSVEDYGFALCGVLAAQIGGTLRREADDAGLRLFLKI